MCERARASHDRFSKRRLGEGKEDMAELPAAGVKRLLTKNGGELRTSTPAVQLVVEAAEEYIARLAQEASAIAQKERRKTIMDGDIRKAREIVG